MRKGAVVLGALLLVGAFAAAIIPMWTMTAGMGLSAAGWGAVILMIVFCFAIGGGLMFLIFFSDRRGYDDAAFRGAIGPDDSTTDDDSVPGEDARPPLDRA